MPRPCYVRKRIAGVRYRPNPAPAPKLKKPRWHTPRGLCLRHLTNDAAMIAYLIVDRRSGRHIKQNESIRKL